MPTSLLSEALRGTTVLDLSRNLAGPYCTMLLGDLGADVIKVESLGLGTTRVIGARPSGMVRAQRSWPVIGTSGASRSTWMRRLGSNWCVASHPVLTLSSRAFDQGLSPSAVLTTSHFMTSTRGLVYCSITAYGSKGPKKDAPGYDPVLQARNRDDVDDRPSRRASRTVGRRGDRLGYRHVGRRRDPSGPTESLRGREGALVEVSLYETADLVALVPHGGLPRYWRESPAARERDSLRRPLRGVRDGRRGSHGHSRERSSLRLVVSGAWSAGPRTESGLLPTTPTGSPTAARSMSSWRIDSKGGPQWSGRSFSAPKPSPAAGSAPWGISSMIRSSTRSECWWTCLTPIFPTYASSTFRSPSTGNAPLTDFLLLGSENRPLPYWRNGSVTGGDSGTHSGTSGFLLAAGHIPESERDQVGFLWRRRSPGERPSCGDTRRG